MWISLVGIILHITKGPSYSSYYNLKDFFQCVRLPTAELQKQGITIRDTLLFHLFVKPRNLISINFQH